MSDAPAELPDDPLLEAQVARAIAPYRAMGLSAAVIEEMECMLRLALLSHPRAQYLLSRLRERAAVKESGEVAIGGVAPASAAKDGTGEGA